MIALLIILACCFAILIAALSQRKDIQSLSFPISFLTLPCGELNFLHASQTPLIFAMAFVAPKFRTPFNFNPEDMVNYEIVDESSQTVPDDSLSVRQLINNFIKGIPIPDGYNEHYAGQNDFDDLPSNRDPNFDLSDITEAQRNREAVARELLLQTAQQQGRKSDEQEDETERSRRSVAKQGKAGKSDSEGDDGLASEAARRQTRNGGGRKDEQVQE